MLLENGRFENFSIHDWNISISQESKQRIENLTCEMVLAHFILPLKWISDTYSKNSIYFVPGYCRVARYGFVNL